MHIVYEIEIDPYQRQLLRRADYILLDFAFDLAALGAYARPTLATVMQQRLAWVKIE